MIREIKETQLDEIIKEGFHIVDIYGTHCVPCKQLSVVFEEIEKEVPQVSILKINTDENKEIVNRFSITSVPTILFYKDGEIVSKKVGFLPKDEIFEVLSDFMY